MLSCEPLLEDLGDLDLKGIHWVIVGGESGGGAREMDTRWVASIIEQCRIVGVPVFVKQLGAKPIAANGPFKILGQDGKKDRKGKSIEPRPMNLQVREFPASMYPAKAIPIANRSRRERSGWQMLETAFATNTKMLTGEEITKEERRQYHEVFRPRRKRVLKVQQAEQIALEMPIGAAMALYFEGATEEDHRLKNGVYQALMDALRSLNMPGLTGRHLSMAAIDLARVAVQIDFM